MKKPNGGFAFPRQLTEGAWPPDECMDIIERHAGMALRDYFAAKIMQTIMIGAVLPTKADRDEHVPRAAEMAYEVADALLVARDA